MLEKLLGKIDLNNRDLVLCKGARDSEIAAAESKLGVLFPNQLREIYSEANGETGSLLHIANKRPYAFFDEFEFLSLEKVIDQHAFLLRTNQKVEVADGALITYPKGFMKISYFNEKWIPIGWSGSGIYLALDLDPDVRGVLGQVIIFGAGLLPEYYVVSRNILEYIDTLSKVIDDYHDDDDLGFIDQIASRYATI